MKNILLILTLLLAGASLAPDTRVFAAEDETVDLFPAEEQCLKILCEEGIFLIEPALKRSEFREMPKEFSALEATQSCAFELEKQIVLFVKVTTDGISSCTYRNGQFVVSSCTDLVPNVVYKDPKGNVTAFLRQARNMQAKKAVVKEDGSVEWAEHDNLKEAAQGAARQIKAVGGAAVAAAVAVKRPANANLRELDTIEFAGKRYVLQLDTDTNLCVLMCTDPKTPAAEPKKLSEFNWDLMNCPVDETRVKLLAVFTTVESEPAQLLINLQNTVYSDKSDLIYSPDGGKNWDVLLDEEWNAKKALASIAPASKK